MKDMIKELKNNWTAWGGLSEEKREFLKEHKDQITSARVDRGFIKSDIPSWKDHVIYRLCPSFEYNENDFEEVKKRWFFNLDSLVAIEDTSGAYGGNAIEVQERDLPYLKKPEPVDGFEWVFKKVKRGETFKLLLTDGVLVADKEWIALPDPSLQGYRWVKVLSQIDPSTCDKKKQGMGRFVEMPIHDEAGQYYCQLPEAYAFDNIPIHELPSIVGFAGVKFSRQEGRELWHMEPTKFMDAKHKLHSDCQDPNDKPATPIKARFWVD